MAGSEARARHGFGCQLAWLSHGARVGKASSRTYSGLAFRDHEELCGANEQHPTNPASPDLPIPFLRT